MAVVALGYIRASTADQILTPHVQLDRIHKYCNACGYTLKSLHEDIGESGSKDWSKRPGLRSAIGELRYLKEEYPEADVVLVVATRCRLARSTMVAAGIHMLCEEIGVRIEASDGAGNGSAPEDILFRTILDAFNQYERARIVLRTQAGRDVKRKRGEYLGGGVPFGSALSIDGKTLVADVTEQEAIRYAVVKRSLGWSYAAIGENLVFHGHNPRKGVAWTSQAVKRLVEKGI